MSATDTTPARSAAYMTPEQSSNLIMLPGDTTTPAQLRYLSDHEMSTNSPVLDKDIQRRAGL
jgi:hypothetical protein